MRTLQTCAAAAREGWIWMFDRHINALFRREINSGVVEYVLSVSDEEAYQVSLFSNIFFYKNQMFLVAYCAKKNVLVNLNDMSQEKIDSRRQENAYGIKTASSVQSGSKIFMFPKFWGDSIDVWDFEDKQLREIKIDYSIVGKHVLLPEDRNVWGGGEIVNGEILLAGIQEAKIARIKKGGSLEIHSVDTVDKGFSRVAASREKVYLTPQDGIELLCLDMQTNTCTQLHKADQSSLQQRVEQPYGGMVVEGNKLILLPFSENQLVMVDLVTGQKRKWNVGGVQSIRAVLYGQKVYILPFSGDEIFELNLETSELSKCQCRRPLTCGKIAFHKYWLCEVFEKRGLSPAYNEVMCSIDQFLEDTPIHSEDAGGQGGESYGVKIWENVKDKQISVKEKNNEMDK